MPSLRHLTTIATWGLLAVPAAFTGAVLAGGRRPAAVTALAAFSMPALGVAVGCLLLAAVLKRPGLLAAAAVVGVPLAVVALPPTWHAHERRSTCGQALRLQEPLRVMTINAELGQADPGRIAELAREEHVGVLAVEELTPRLAQAVSNGVKAALPYQHVLAGPGPVGTGLWSATPLTPLPKLTSTTFHGPRARLALGEQLVDIAAVHPASPGSLSYALWEREQNALADELARLDDGAPRIVLGDFNAGMGHAPFRRLLGTAHLDDAADLAGSWPGFTWPADHRHLPPLTRIDHVLVSAAFTATDVRTHPVPGTDHRAVVAVLAPGVCSPRGR